MRNPGGYTCRCATQLEAAAAPVEHNRFDNMNAHRTSGDPAVLASEMRLGMNDFGRCRKVKTSKPIAARLGHLLIIGLMLTALHRVGRRSISAPAAHTDTRTGFCTASGAGLMVGMLAIV